MGVRFQSTSLSPGTHYGYLNLTRNGSTLTVTGWGYETTADTAITTAETATPEPATSIPIGLGLLALGAAGLRRKRAAQSA
jgi:hypothetical protein